MPEFTDRDFIFSSEDLANKVIAFLRWGRQVLVQGWRMGMMVVLGGVSGSLRGRDGDVFRGWYGGSIRG